MPVASRTPGAGMLRQTITYLEMTDVPAAPQAGAGAQDCRLEPPVRLSPAEYRALQRTVGEQWLWWERLALSDEELRAIIHDPLVEVRRLRRRDDVLGFSEIDRRDPVDVEITFLGLVPEAIGRGLGRLLLGSTLASAWTGPARRVWLHTCDHDHPKALAFYRRTRFRVVRVETVEVPDPRLTGLLPEEAAPHVPLAKRAAAR